MNDVKHLCEVALDVDAPPLREAEQVLALASRAAARRDRVVAASVGLAGVTVVAALVTPALLPSRPPAVSAPAVVAEPPKAPVSVSAAVSVPPANVPATRDRVVYDLLVAALPAGYEGRSRYPFADPSQPAVRLDQTPSAGALRIFMTANVLVSDGRGEGQLWAAVLGDGTTGPTDDPCALPGVGRECRVINVAGVPVAVWHEDDGQGGDTLVARRQMQGWYLMVVAQRSVPVYGADTTLPPDAVGGQLENAVKRPPLADWFIDADRLAALAGNPAMLP
ncbi:hypothetical protein ACFO1B_17355 [Dactylosporangium siamense]|uniref:Uncharacterized protein n=1 Tax=Dactylosporangium siamense TaxID=685454 RepID=A0A919U7K3_9ACTN|nr:hypothetical protein [Dactylosporangium siamense]GIG45609.1 hypothetical protein Dsi01nite_036500 [Dactylosporangium siamense]